jgi:rod shape-determining protein MreD
LRSFLLVLLLLVLLALQSPIFGLLGVRASLIDFPLIATLYFASTSRAVRGFVASSIIGFIADGFTPGGLLGMNAEIHGIVFLLALGLSARFSLTRPAPLLLVTAVSSVLKTLLFYLFSLVFDRAFEPRIEVLLWGLPTCLATAVLAPLLFLPFAGVDRIVAGRRTNESLLR